MRLPCLLASACIVLLLILPPAGAVTDEAKAQWKVAFDLYNSGKCPMALAASEKAIALDPTFGPSWNVKGCALHCLGQNQEALDAFDKAFALDPSLDIAKKNHDRIQLLVQNGAPLSTPPIVLPEVSNESIPHDGELAIAPTGYLTNCGVLIPDGHAVYFANNKTINVTGVRVAGCRYGTDDGKAKIEIWDRNFNTVSSDTIPYAAIPLPTVQTGGSTCITNSSWVDIPLTAREVTGDFYVVIFTGSFPMSADGSGIMIDYSTPSESGTSYAMTTQPDRIDDSLINPVNGKYNTSDLDWMVRVLYKDVPAPAATVVTTGGATASPEGGLLNASGGPGTAAAGPGQAPAATTTIRTPVAAGLAVLGISAGALCRRMRR